MIPKKADGTFAKGFISPLRNGEFRSCQVCNEQFYISGNRVPDLTRGKFCSQKCKGIASKTLRRSPETEFKPGEMVGEKHHAWKGDAVCYRVIHAYIRGHYGKPDKCERCEHPKGRFEWANITGVYTKARENWQMLCRSCHVREDKLNPKRPKI